MKTDAIEIEVDESLERRALAIAEATGLDPEAVLNQALITGYLLTLLERDAVD